MKVGHVRILPAKFLAPDGAALSFQAYIFLILFCIASFAPGFVTLPPTDRDESSFAQASKQMIESGNYVDIRLQDKPRYKKPAGIYWLQAASARLFNPDHLNEIWAYRIPSFIGASVAVLMTAALGALLFGPSAGFLAAIMMAGCVILNAEARLAKTDAALLACIVTAQYALAKTYLRRDRDGNGSRGVWLVFWTALGAGLLIKGPIIVLIVISTLLWLRVMDKNLRWFADLKPLIGIPYLVLLTAPWFTAIALQSQGQFLHDAAGHDMLAKIWQGQDRGFMPPGLHLLAMPVVFFPFSLFAALAAPDIWKNRTDPVVRFCLGWILPAWLVFELALTKLPHYTLPLYPPLALLAAKFVCDGFPALGARKFWWLATLAIGVWLALGVGFAVAFAALPYAVDHQWTASSIAAGAILVLAQGASLFLLVQRKAGGVFTLAAGNLIFMSLIFGGVLPGLQHFWVSREVVRLAETAKPCDKLQIVSASYGEPSLVFAAGTDTKIVADGAAAAAVLKKDRCFAGLIDADHKKSFLDALSGSRESLEIGNVEGFNIGHGRATQLTLYRMKAGR